MPCRSTVLGVMVDSHATRGRQRCIAAPFLAGIFALLGLVDVAAAASKAGPVSGVVVDPAGKPVAGAKVWLVSADGNFPFGAPRTLAETTTGEKGGFLFPAVKWERSSPTGPTPMLAARDPQGRLGAAELDVPSYTKGIVPSVARITLFEGKEFEGRMTDAAGKPIAKASVVPLLRVSDDDSPRGLSLLILPAELEKELTAETDADGQFRMKSFPASGQLYAHLRAGEFGEPLAMLKLGKAVAIRLERTGALQLTATCPKDPKAVAGLPFVIVSSSMESGPEEKDGVALFYCHEAKTRDDGTLSMANIPPGKYTVKSKFLASFPYCESAAVSAEVKPGGTAREKVVLKPAVKLQGTVDDRATSKGVGGVRVALFEQIPVGFRDVLTDADGKFTIYVKPGTARVFVWEAPEPYLAPAMMEEMVEVDAKEEGVVPTVLLNLDRTLPVEALVVDSDGRPIAEAEIRVASKSEDEPETAFGKVMRSDAAGKVALGEFTSKQTVAIRARAKDAAAPMKTIEVGKQQGPVRLVLMEKTAFGVRGVLVDDAGTPIAANLKLLAFQAQSPASDGRYRSIHSWLDGFVNLGETGVAVYAPDGKFSMTGLWPDVRYRLLVKLPGHERYASAMVSAAAGKTHDFGRIALARTSETVEGSVVDSAGKPIAGARVFNAGDGPEPMETRTDAAGRFRLTGFRKGPVCVFATIDGYQFAGLRTTAGATDATVKMLRSDESAAKRPIATAAIPPDEQKKLARGLLVKAWETVKNKKQSGSGGITAAVSRALLEGLVGDPCDAKDVAAGQRAEIVELMAKIDAEQAKRWEAESSAKKPAAAPVVSSSRREAVAKQEAILKAAEDDVDEAISMLEKAPEQSVGQLRVLVEHFAEKDREKALRFAEEGIARTRGLQQPDRTTETIRWVGTVDRLGNKAAARKLIEEAADTADRWKPNDRYDRSFGAIAVAIAPYDAARAIALLKKMSNEYYRRTYRMLAAVAFDDIRQVEALLKDTDAETIKNVRVQWAYRVAAARPAEAVRAVEAIAKQTAADEMMAFFAGLAERIGTHDSALTCSLIDRCMACMLPAKPVTDEAADIRPAAFQAARLAVVARKVGYGDMEGLVFRVMALRPTPGKDDSPLPARDATLQMAGVLALTDPAAARSILRTLEPSAETIEDRVAWLQAWALADPHHAAELAEKALAGAKSGDDADGALAAALAVVRFWTLSPDEQIKAIVPGFGEEREAGMRGLPPPGSMDFDL